MKFGLTFTFQSPNGEGLTQLYNTALDQIVLAEKYGFENISVSEHHFAPTGWFSKAMAACAGIATRTKRIQLCTNIIVLPFYNPIHAAEEAAVVDIISGGRFTLGVGVGYRKEEFKGFRVNRDERVNIFEEGALLTRKLLNERNVSYDGKYYKLDDVTVMPRPVKNPFPIWIAATSDRGVQLAAKYGDAWAAGQDFSIEGQFGEVFRRRLKLYNDECKRSGKQPRIPTLREAFIAETTDKAWEIAGPPLSFLYKEEYYKWGHFFGENGEPVRPENMDYSKVYELLKKRTIVGGPDDFIAGVEKYEKFGIDLLILRMYFPGLSSEHLTNAIKLIGERVIPYFEARAR